MTKPVVLLDVNVFPTTWLLDILTSMLSRPSIPMISCAPYWNKTRTMYWT